MDATTGELGLEWKPRKQHSRIGRLFDSKPFLVYVVPVAHGGAAADLSDVPAGVGPVAVADRHHHRPARRVHRAG